MGQNGGLLVEASLPAECATVYRLEGAGNGVVDSRDDLWQAILDDAPFDGGQRYNRQLPPAQILLIVESLISRNEYLEAVVFGCLQESAVLEPIPPLIAGGENLM